MKLKVGPFRLEAPQVAPENLPEGFASSATNCRVLSGALEPWKQDSPQAQLVTKSGPIRSIHLLDVDGSDGGPYLLHWQNDVQVARAPVLDANEQTFYTGDGAPKVTNLVLAQNSPGQDATGLPHDWLLLGSPAPNIAPVATSSDTTGQIDENEIVVQNSNAEQSLPDGNWFDTTGTLSRHGTVPIDGNWSFTGGDDAATESYQDLEIPTASGRKVKLRYERTSDETDLLTGGRARMGVQFFNESAVKVYELLDDWGIDGIREISTQGMSSDVSYVRLVQFFERTGTGPGAPDALIDLVEVFTLDPDDLYFDGSTFEGWSFHLEGDQPSLASSASHKLGTEDDQAFIFSSENDRKNLIFRNFDLALASSYTTKTRFIQPQVGQSKWTHLLVHLNMSVAGDGVNLEYEHNGAIKVSGLVAWQKQKPYFETGFTTFRSRWYKTSITVASVGARKKLTVVTEWDDDPDYTGEKWGGIGDRYENSKTFTTDLIGYTDGDYLGFGAVNHSDHPRYMVIDWISFASTLRAINGSGSSADLVLFTNYVHTWYNSEFGYMSAPSPASENRELGNNHEIEITRDESPPAGYGIDKWYLWRLVAASDDTSSYRLVSINDLIDTTYLDTTVDDELEEDILPSIGWSTPPTNGHSIVAAANGINYIAKDNQVYPSPVGQPHAYPPLWAQKTDYDVVALAALAADVYALTQAHPYVITGSDPSELDMEKLAKPIGCMSSRSVAVDRRLGVVYSAADGMAYANRADVGLITEGWVTEREWAAFDPANITGLIYDNNYIGFNNTFGFFIDLSGKTGIGRLDFVATALDLNTITGNLHMIVDGVHVTFNTAAGLRIFDWYSKDFLMPSPKSFQMARIEFGANGTGGATFKVYYDDVLVSTQTVTTSDEFLLPDNSASHVVKIRVIGSQTIRRLSLVESVDELIA